MKKIIQPMMYKFAEVIHSLGFRKAAIRIWLKWAKMVCETND